MGLLHANLKAALQKETGVQAGWVAEFDLIQTPGAGATTVRYATEDVASWEKGHYDGLITDPGEGRRGVSLFGCDLQIPQTTITLLDKDRFWAKLARGPVSRNLPGSPARIYMTSAALADFDESFKETNMVIHSWQRKGDHEVTLTLKPDTVLLERALPDLVLTETLYPFADPAVWGTFATLCYGIFDSAPTTGKGMIPAFCVDRNDKRFWAMLGKITITAVFLDGVKFTDYVVEYVERGGYDVTEIVFPNGLGEDVEDPSDVAITFDCEGYRDNTGNLITTPVAIIAHFLRNFVFGSPTGTLWKKGPWLGSCPMINTAAGSGFIKSHLYFFERNISGAVYLGGTTQRKALEALNEWANSWFVKPYIMNDGRLDLLLLDPSKYRPTGNELYIRENDVSAFVPKDENGMIRKVMVQYHLDPVAGSYGKNVDTTDFTVPGNKGVLPHQLSWGPVNEGDNVFLESAPDTDSLEF